MTSERLVQLAGAGVSPVLEELRTASLSARELEQEQAGIRRLENEMKETAALMDVVKRQRFDDR